MIQRSVSFSSSQNLEVIRWVTSLLSPSKNMQFCNEQIRTQPLFSPPCAGAAYGSARMCRRKNTITATLRWGSYGPGTGSSPGPQECPVQGYQEEAGRIFSGPWIQYVLRHQFSINRLKRILCWDSFYLFYRHVTCSPGWNFTRHLVSISPKYLAELRGPKATARKRLWRVRAPRTRFQ